MEQIRTTAAATNLLTHCTRLGIKPAPPQSDSYFFNFLSFVFFVVVLVVIVAISWAAPAAYGGSQARGLIRDSHPQRLKPSASPGTTLDLSWSLSLSKVYTVNYLEDICDIVDVASMR
uniref:Uncharacterized protein n=1 Tax=Sus scrofa TaxID=9823 RepID=A0A8W4FQ26_PIG